MAIFRVQLELRAPAVWMKYCGRRKQIVGGAQDPSASRFRRLVAKSPLRREPRPQLKHWTRRQKARRGCGIRKPDCRATAARRV